MFFGNFDNLTHCFNSIAFDNYCSKSYHRFLLSFECNQANERTSLFYMAMIKHRVFLKIQKTLAQNYKIVNIYYGVFEIKYFSIVFNVAHLKLTNERNTSKKKKKKKITSCRPSQHVLAKWKIFYPLLSFTALNIITQIFSIFLEIFNPLLKYVIK